MTLLKLACILLRRTVSGESRLAARHRSIEAQKERLRVSLSDTNTTQSTPPLGPIGDQCRTGVEALAGSARHIRLKPCLHRRTRRRVKMQVFHGEPHEIVRRHGLNVRYDMRYVLDTDVLVAGLRSHTGASRQLLMLLPLPVSP